MGLTISVLTEEAPSDFPFWSALWTRESLGVVLKLLLLLNPLGLQIGEMGVRETDTHIL
jgi:hypothetical protein